MERPSRVGILAGFGSAGLVISALLWPAPQDNGIVSKRSTHSVDETVKRLETLLESKGIKLFAVVDHSGEAERAGLKMPATKLVIFGNPKAGTPLMLAAPSIALDLPLKVLVSEDAGGTVWVADQAAGLLRIAPNGRLERTPWSALGRSDFATTMAADRTHGGVWLGFWDGGIGRFQ